MTLFVTLNYDGEDMQTKQAAKHTDSARCRTAAVISTSLLDPIKPTSGWDADRIYSVYNASSTENVSV